jgi:predicted acyl esterase
MAIAASGSGHRVRLDLSSSSFSDSDTDSNIGDAFTKRRPKVAAARSIIRLAVDHASDGLLSKCATAATEAVRRG